MTISFDAAAAERFLKLAAEMSGTGSESPLRHLLSSHLPKMFPGTSTPWWVQWHAKGSETLIHSHQDGRSKRGFIDTLVGSTAIEYEKNLRNARSTAHGEDQVREYCAGLLNRGVPADSIIGILSDTVRWRAYRIESLHPKADGTVLFGAQHVVLEQLEALDLSRAGRTEAAALLHFLSRYVGRLGNRVLGADTLAADLGFESEFCANHLSGIKALVDGAFVANPAYARLIEKVWSDFVAYLGDSRTSGAFDRDTYISELYVLTLAKLLCADVIEGSYRISDDSELESILNGTFFQKRGFSNLVEFDYFGWLNEGDNVRHLLPTARDIQADLAAYDFAAAPAEDVFGGVMAQLARKSQRVLLGQEWTPAWLARSVVSRVLSCIPADDDPRLVDMCCGSGSMIVETVKQTQARFKRNGVQPDAASVTRLARAITGFDIDPMAVMLAKISWVLAAREWLSKAGAFDVAIPVYHADSLFVSTPVARKVDADGAVRHLLDLDGRKVSLPAFLISPDHVALFDAVVGIVHDLAMGAAAANPPETLTGWPERILGEACVNTCVKLDARKTKRTIAFIAELLTALEALQRAGRNGIWTFVLANSYRPGLVTGMFNGLVSNPPWLAMSKIADNPYKTSLTEIAEAHGIKPAGPSHLHAEMATIFLLHSISRYLAPGASVGCVLPESVTSAHHHDPFRRGAYLAADKPVRFTPNEIWRVQRGTFKNEAIVLFGIKVAPGAGPLSLHGQLASPSGVSALPFRVITQGDRSAWSSVSGARAADAFLGAAPFKQGADVFPRTAVFHRLTKAGVRYDISRIDREAGDLAYLVKGAKNFKDFSLTAHGVSREFVFEVLLSNHLTPFRIARAAQALLPLRKEEGEWKPAANLNIRAAGLATARAFSTILRTLGMTSNAYFAAIDTPRRKLSNQVFPSQGWLVVMGAGGKHVCAAHANLADLDVSRLIVDQTLYWVVVPSENEALYLTGSLNSEAVSTVIQQFQPRGRFGERHVHTLPLDFTPRFDRHDPTQIAVVSNTRILMKQLRADEAADSADSADYDDLLNPNQALAGRRTRIRNRLKTFPGYGDYDLACRALYGL